MKRKPRNLIISLAFLLVASIGIITVRTVKGKSPEDESEKAPLITNFDSADLRQVKIENESDTIDFRSTSGTEWIAAPLTKYFRWAPNKVQSLVDSLARIQSKRQIEKKASEDKLVEYGLAKPIANVQIQDSKDLKISISIGDKSLSGSGRYASDDSGNVFLINESLFDSIMAKAETYRDLSLPGILFPSLKSLEYQHQGSKVKITKAEDSESLLLTEPWKAAVDRTLLNQAFNNGTAIPTEVSLFADKISINDASIGLNNPKTDYFRIEDTAGNLLSIILGKINPDGKRFGRLADREDAAFLLEANSLDFLQTEAFQLIEKTLVKIPEEEISGIEVSDSKDSWKLARKDKAYTINGTDLSTEDFASIYQKLTEIIRHALGTDGKNEPEITIRINSNKEENSFVLLFWPFDESSFIVKVSNEDVNYLATRVQVSSFIESLKNPGGQESEDSESEDSESEDSESASQNAS